MTSARDPMLDGLRGFAALIVLVAHSAGAGYLPDIFSQGAGKIGVALFFALSGYLMAELYLDRDFEWLGQVRPYLIRRAARVLPLYFAVVLVVSAVWVAGFPSYGVDRAAKAIWNLLLIRGTSVFWSVPVEIHFYLLFVFLWYLTSKGFFAFGIGCLILLQLVGVPLLGAIATPNAFVVNWLSVFLTGILAARLKVPLARLLSGKRREAAAIALMAAFPFMLPAVRSALSLGGAEKSMDVAGLAFVLCFFVVAMSRPKAFGWLTVAPLTAIGRISYSLYLLHLAVILVVSVLVPQTAGWVWMGFPVIVLASIGLAALSYWFIERPADTFMRKKLI